MIPDLKPVNVALKVSRTLSYWVILVHVLPAIAILLLGLSFGLNLMITIALLLVVCLGYLHCSRKIRRAKWSKISFDGRQWALLPASSTPGEKPVLLELAYYYRFGKSWILGFHQLDKQKKRIIIPLLPDMCGAEDCDSNSNEYGSDGSYEPDNGGLIDISHVLLMANN